MSATAAQAATGMPTVGELWERTGTGDRAAAEEIVRRYTPMLRAVTHRAGLTEQRAHDVIQTTWLRLFESPAAIHEPERLGGWLRTVATREAWRSTRMARREIGCSDRLVALAGTTPDPTERIEEEERLAWLRSAIASLPERQRRLIQVLLAEPHLSYEQVAERIGMPIGSIGPTRARALERLRALRPTDAPRQPVATAPIRRPRRPASTPRLVVAL